MMRLTKMNAEGSYEFDFGVLSSKGWSKQDFINYIAQLENTRDNYIAKAELNMKYGIARMEQEKKFREFREAVSLFGLI